MSKTLFKEYYKMQYINPHIINKKIEIDIPKNGLLAYYPFKGNANDESGNGNHGIISGASLTTDRFGNINSAYLFQDGDSIILNSLISFDNDFTLMFWMNANYLSAYKSLLSSNSSNIRTRSDRSQLISPGVFTLNKNISTNQWYQFLIEFDSSIDTYNWYINNNFETSLISSTYSVEFDTIGTGASGSFLGKLDDLAFYSRLLTLQEKSDIFTLGGWS